jgi:hypothetical protein
LKKKNKKNNQSFDVLFLPSSIIMMKKNYIMATKKKKAKINPYIIKMDAIMIIILTPLKIMWLFKMILKIKIINPPF